MHPSQKQDLNRQLDSLLTRIDESIEAIETKAIQQGMNPHEMMYVDGKHVMAPVLVAKAEALNAKVILNVRDS